MVDADEKYMLKALALAERGIGSVEPNPAAGCVIVKANQIIGMGWHKKFGGPHAEINAIEDCKTLGASPAGATMYVTLEPCCHQGQTGPCTEAIIKAKIAKVVAATIDPSPHASGKGFEQLHAGGVEVQIGLCQEEAKRLNAPFIKFASTGRCWVILKWAQSIDGKLAWQRPAVGRRWISNEMSRKDAQKLRRRVQGIVVGINTVLADDPLLTARPGRKTQPIRVVLDANLRIPLTCRLLRTIKKAPVLVVTGAQAVEQNAAKAEKLKKKGAEVATVAAAWGLCDIESVLARLAERGVSQLLVEGGPEVIAQFLKGGLADEVCVYLAAKILGGEGAVNISEPMARLASATGLNYVKIKQLGNDVRITGLLKQ